MATYFGEVQELTSRAVDIDEIENQPACSLTVQTTENYSTNHKYNVMIVCIGELAKAFSQVYLASNNSKTLLNILYSFETIENTSLLYDGHNKNQKDNVAASLYSSDPDALICEIPIQLPETIHVDLIQEILNHIECNSAIVLTSAPFVTLKGDCSSCSQPPQLLGLANSFYSDSVLTRLWSPNFVSGLAAAVLTEFEVRQKPALCVINYAETNTLDVVNVQAFEKLTLLKGLTNVIQNDRESMLMNFVKKNSRESNLYI